MDEIIKGFGSLYCPMEQEGALKLFQLLKDGLLSELAELYFNRTTCDVYLNPNSGHVFLCDEDYNTVMSDGNCLDLFISTPYEGEEGFFTEIMDRWEDLHDDDKQYMFELATEAYREQYKEEFRNQR